MTKRMVPLAVFFLMGTTISCAGGVRLAGGPQPAGLAAPSAEVVPPPPPPPKASTAGHGLERDGISRSVDSFEPLAHEATQVTLKQVSGQSALNLEGLRVVVVHAVSDCAAPGPPSSAEFAIQVKLPAIAVSAAGQPDGFVGCVRARLDDFSGLLSTGTFVANASWYKPPNPELPPLDYPLPRASARLTLQYASTLPPSQRELGEQLINKLKSGGYQEHLHWYRFLDGFALMTFPEKIDKKGAALFADKPSTRFATDFKRAGLGERILSIFRTEPLRYRVIVFACATGPFFDNGKAPSLEQLPPAQSGAAVNAPLELGTMPKSANTKLVAYVYVYERAQGNAPARQLHETDGVDPRSHLAKAGVLP